MRVRSEAFSIAVSLLLLFAPITRGDDAALAKELTDKGAKITETKGVITGVDVPVISKWTDDDFSKIAQLSHLQRLSFGLGLTNHQLSLLIHLPEITAFSTNGSQLDDDGVRQFANFKNLTVLTFFHPTPKFTGVGLADLDVLPRLESLTVAGSNAFGNDGLAAIGKLSHLKSLRSWHTNIDPAGLAFLKDLKELQSITINYEPRTSPGNDPIAIFASMKSLTSIAIMEERFSLADLSQLKELPALTRLTLTSIDISEADMAKLKEELPKVQIKWTAPTPAEVKRIQTAIDQKK